MTEDVDIIPILAQAPPDDLVDWKDSNIKVNGYNVPVSKYLRDPIPYNTKPMSKDYLNSVRKDASPILKQALKSYK